MGILIIAEHDNTALKSPTLNTINAASSIGGEITVLVAGSNCSAVAEAVSSTDQVSKVVLVDEPHYEYQLAENIAPLIQGMAADYSHILAPATTYGKNLMPRVAALLDVAQISDIVTVESEDTFVRPIYAGNIMATVKSMDLVKVITVRPSAFDAVSATGGNAGIEKAAAAAETNISRFIRHETNDSQRPDLSSARVVVAGGRGVQGGENFELMERVADRLDAAIGASRALVDAGLAPNDLQIGQTGKVIAPELYIAMGISGAIQHLAGILDSKVIVAINRDADAPIFKVADYGLVADLQQALPELVDELEKLQG